MGEKSGEIKARGTGPTELPNSLAGGTNAGREPRRGAPLPAGRRCAGDYF